MSATNRPPVDWMARWIDIIDWEVNTALSDEEVGELLGNVLAA